MHTVSCIVVITNEFLTLPHQKKRAQDKELTLEMRVKLTHSFNKVANLSSHTQLMIEGWPRVCYHIVSPING